MLTLSWSSLAHTRFSLTKSWISRIQSSSVLGGGASWRFQPWLTSILSVHGTRRDDCGMKAHEMMEVHGAEQRGVVLHSTIEILAGRIGPGNVLRVHKAQDMVHNLKGELCEENHGCTCTTA